MIKKTILVLIFLFSSNPMAFELKEKMSASQIWLQSKKLAGKPESMGQRSLMFHKMYLDSEHLMPFALSVSHLTLAIERSIDFGRLGDMPTLVPLSNTLNRDTKLWRESLRLMNQDMFMRTYFAYMYAKHIAVFTKAPIATREDRRIVDSVQSIIPTLVEMHQLKMRKDKLDEVTRDQHFDTLVRWEHYELFQPQLEVVFRNLSWAMRMSLQRIPGPWLEKRILTPLFKMRSSLNLQCFLDPNKKLVTSDFMNPNQRVEQAKRFYRELERIHFDPANFCYNDEYYITMFPQTFFDHADAYLTELVGKILSEDKSFEPAQRLRELKNTFPIKSSSLRLFRKIKDSNLCRSNSLDFWKHYPSNLIDFPSEVLKSFLAKKNAVSSMEMGIAKNVLINRAYIDLLLYHSSRDGILSKEIIPFSWLGSASYGSYSVGKQMIYGMYKIFKKNKGNTFFDQFLPEDLKKVQDYMSGHSTLYASMKPFLSTLASANQAVFHDIFWQFLATEACGVDKLINLLKQSKTLADRESLKGWLMLRNSSYLAGNLQLLKVEQQYVLQPLLYNSMGSKFFSHRRTFNHYAIAGAPGPNGELKNFDEYSKETGFDSNLSQLASRMNWVNYLVENHALYFQMKNREGTLPSSLSQVTDFSDKIIDYYQQ